MLESTNYETDYRQNMNQKLYVDCYIIGWRSYSLCNNVSIYLNKEIQFRRTFKQGWGVIKYFETALSQ